MDGNNPGKSTTHNPSWTIQEFRLNRIHSVQERVIAGEMPMIHDF
jgi:hypothetical protein